jgi:urease accessory protein
MVETGEPPQAVLVNTAGGIVGGDEISTEIALGPGAAATVTTQAAEKLYRSLGPDARISNRLSLATGALLEWLPQEAILFEGARLRRRLEIELAEDARLIAAETVLFGRTAHGETLTRGLFHDAWRIRVGTRLAFAETTRLDGDIAAQRRRPFGFGDAAGFGLVVVAGRDAGSFLPAARTIAEASGLAAGASMVNGVLLLRLMGPDAQILRREVSRAILALRRDVVGLPARLPRNWLA